MLIEFLVIVHRTVALGSATKGLSFSCFNFHSVTSSPAFRQSFGALTMETETGWP